MPFNGETEVVVERTDGAGPPRRGWLGGAGRSMGAPGGRVAGLVWFLSRHGRYGRAVMLHQHLRERWGAVRRVRGPGRGLLLACARRPDAAAVRRRTVSAAMRWAALTGRLCRGRPRRQAVLGALAAPLAVPALVVIGVLLAVLLVADVGLWALSTLGNSVRTAVVRPAEDGAPSPRPSFDWTTP